MRTHLRTTVFGLSCAAALVSQPLLFVPNSDAAIQQFDEDVPPGNPVIGSDRPGDLEIEAGTNYGLWIALAVCLIAAGILLVKVERWEASRHS